MNCKTIEMLLYNYLDDELTEQEYFEVEEHLKICSSCRNLYNYESEFHKFFKAKIKTNMTKAPLDLKEKILNNKKQYLFNYNIFTIKGLSSVSILLVSIVFISKMSMGYSTISENYDLEFKKDIKIVSNNENKLSKWILYHNYKSFKLLKFDKEKIKITPLGLAFNKNKPIVYYHYKGNKLIYKNITSPIPTDQLKKIKIKNKVFFIRNTEGISTAIWKNKDGTSSLLSSKIPEKQLKTILYAIK